MGRELASARVKNQAARVTTRQVVSAFYGIRLPLASTGPGPRQRLEEDARRPTIIKTVWSEGYVLAAEVRIDN